MIEKNQTISLNRNCEAELIPSGDKINLLKGEVVKVTQSLGGNYTLFINGNLVKIRGKDADVIGLETLRLGLRSDTFFVFENKE